MRPAKFIFLGGGGGGGGLRGKKKKKTELEHLKKFFQKLAH